MDQQETRDELDAHFIQSGYIRQYNKDIPIEICNLIFWFWYQSIKITIGLNDMLYKQYPPHMRNQTDPDTFHEIITQLKQANMPLSHFGCQIRIPVFVIQINQSYTLPVIYAIVKTMKQVRKICKAFVMSENNSYQVALFTDNKDMETAVQEFLPTVLSRVRFFEQDKFVFEFAKYLIQTWHKCHQCLSLKDKAFWKKGHLC